MHEWMRWQPTRARRFSSLLLEPARIVVGIGGACVVLGGCMPWADGVAPSYAGTGPEFFSGLGGAGDGLVELFLGAITAFLVLHRTPAGSRVRTVRLLPAILVVLAALTWISGYRAAIDAIDTWVKRGGHGTIAPGLWLVGVGVLLMAAGTLRLLPSALRWQSEAGDPGDLVAVSRGGVAVAIASLAGTVVGAGLGISIGLSLTGPMVLGMLAFGATFGGLFGAYGGAWAMRALLRAIGARGG